MSAMVSAHQRCSYSYSEIRRSTRLCARATAWVGRAYLHKTVECVARGGRAGEASRRGEQAAKLCEAQARGPRR